jgi:hypothetical protein
MEQAKCGEMLWKKDDIKFRRVRLRADRLVDGRKSFDRVRSRWFREIAALRWQ